MRPESDSLQVSNKDIAGLLKTTCEKGIPFKFTANGASMSPFICNGDSLIIYPIFKKRKIKIGDIVAFITPSEGLLIIHRIIKVNGQYLLKGDNVYHNDGYCEKKYIHGYVKKVIIIEKKLPIYRKTIRKLFLFLNNFKKIIALLSRYKILTPVCRLFNKFL